MRLVSKFSNTETKRTAKVQWNPEFREYIVKLWQGMEFQAEATYFTNDLEDAEATAQKMIA